MATLAGRLFSGAVELPGVLIGVTARAVQRQRLVAGQAAFARRRVAVVAGHRLVRPFEGKARLLVVERERMKAAHLVAAGARSARFGELPFVHVLVTALALAEWLGEVESRGAEQRQTGFLFQRHANGRGHPSKQPGRGWVAARAGYCLVRAFKRVPGALVRGVTRPVTAALWRPGSYHGSLTTQPGACLDCHAASEPTVATRSTVSYALAEGGTASNARQWLSHLSSMVAGRDCVGCHQADAQRTGSAWNTGTRFHAKVTNATGCKECHGLSNGMGSVPGTNNNLPAGLVSSVTVSTIAGVAGSGVAAGTKDQISHADLNVANRDCNFCHTQVGPSSTAGVMGQEWAQARFHANFNSAANPLLINNTTARCSNCHLNVKPAAGYSPQDHSAFTNVAGSQDCASCHSFPGTGTVGAANWKGASGMPPFISVGGFTIAVPPAAAGTVQGGIANLPHPTVAAGTACTACHAAASGGRRAIGYDHASSLINANCRACHEAGSDLVGTAWNPTASGATNLQASCGEGGGSIRDRAGDTRAIGLGSLACTDKATSKTCGSANCVTNHFYPADCHECHTKPSGVTVTKTGTSYVSGWRFPHSQGNMQQTTCCMCHDARTNGSCRP